MLRVGLYIGQNGAGLRSCASAARRLRARTVTMLGAEAGSPASQAAILAHMQERLRSGEFDAIIAWIAAEAVLSFDTRANPSAELSTRLPTQGTHLSVDDNQPGSEM